MSFVYFITARDQGICKIGYARNVEARRASLQTASPVKLTVEAVVPGARELEREFHDRFAASRLSGEWFTITDELEALIRESAASVVVPLPVSAPEKMAATTDEEWVAEYDATCARMLAEAMECFAALDPPQCDDLPSSPARFYQPVAAGCGCFIKHFAVRGGGRRFCEGMHLSWDQADRLCDIFEDVRQSALELPRQRPAQEAA